MPTLEELTKFVSELSEEECKNIVLYYKNSFDVLHADFVERNTSYVHYPSDNKRFMTPKAFMERTTSNYVVNNYIENSNLDVWSINSNYYKFVISHKEVLHYLGYDNSENTAHISDMYFTFKKNNVLCTISINSLLLPTSVTLSSNRQSNPTRPFSKKHYSLTYKDFLLIAINSPEPNLQSDNNDTNGISNLSYESIYKSSLLLNIVSMSKEVKGNLQLLHKIDKNNDNDTYKLNTSPNQLVLNDNLKHFAIEQLEKVVNIEELDDNSIAVTLIFGTLNEPSFALDMVTDDYEYQVYRLCKQVTYRLKIKDTLVVDMEVGYYNKPYTIFTNTYEGENFSKVDSLTNAIKGVFIGKTFQELKDMDIVNFAYHKMLNYLPTELKNHLKDNMELPNE